MRTNPGLQDISATSNDPATVTKLAPALPRPLRPAQNMATSFDVNPTKEYLTTRGYSDSAVPHCRATVAKEYENHRPTGPLPADLVDHVDERGIKSTQSVHLKSRPQFQLPCFKTLGIASRLPYALLTPPDDTILDLKAAVPPNPTSRSSSYPPANMPKTPSPERTDLTAILTNDLSITEASGSAQPSMAATEPQDIVDEEATGPMSSSSEDEDVDHAYAGWIEDAVDTAGKLTLSS